MRHCSMFRQVLNTVEVSAVKMKTLVHKLRLLLLLIVFIQLSLGPLVAHAQTVVIGAKGADGQDARHGSDGGTGGDGSDAGRSSRGQDAGDIDIELRDLNAGTSTRMNYHIFGTVSGQGVGQTVTYDGGMLMLDASGGKGGDGGRGGDGGDGRRGTDGRDATKGSSGTDGTNGGPGGDGGNGSPGSDGGDGGVVKVRLDAANTHLAMLVQYDVSGGDGGAPGANGRGGDGGRGGQGGSSYSWTERVYKGQDCHTEEDVVSNGDGSYSTRSRRVCVDDYDTEYHSNSGGSDGRDGRDGSNGSGNTSAGSRGANGFFEFAVTDSNGRVSRYKTIYDMNLINYSLIDENRDGVFEPGEKVIVRNITVSNRGEMPSPNGKAKVMVVLRTGQWFIANPIELEVPSLRSGESTTLSGQLEFTIKDNTVVGNNERFEISDSLTPVSYLTRVNKTFSGFELPKTIRVTYPIEISPLVARKSVGPGEMIDVHWKVTNLSTKSFGSDSELKRAIFTSIYESRPSTKGAKVTFITEGQQAPLNERFSQEVVNLEPGKSMIIAGKLRFREDLEVYTNVDISHSLGLQRHTDDRVQTIQENSFQFTISQIYRPNADSDFLLILNDQTTRQEYLAWNSLAQRLGLKFDIWDVSYYGFLSLSQKVEEANQSFLDSYRGKSIVLINNEQANRQRPYLMVAQRDFLLGAQNYDVNFLVMGGRGDHSSQLVQSLLLSDVEAVDFKTLGDFSALSAPTSSSGIMVRGQARNWQSSLELFKAKETELRDRLAETKPEQDFYIKSEFLNRREGAGYALGRFQIVPSLSLHQGHLVALNVKDEIVHRPEFIASHENVMALVLTAPMGTKLKILEQMTYDTTLDRVLYNAIVHDLVLSIENEDRQHDSVQDESSIKAQLRNLAVLGKKLGSVERKALAVRVLAGLEFYLNETKSSGWFGWSKNSFKSELQQIVKSHLSDLKPDQKIVAAHKDRLTKELARREERLVGLEHNESLLRMFTWPAVHTAESSRQMIHGTEMKGRHQ